MSSIPQLINGVERNAANPKTFHIPDMEKRCSLTVGEYAKIGLEIPGGRGERFWVKIVEVRENYVAIVDNDLVIFPHISIGSKIEFSQEHVLSTLTWPNTSNS